MLRAALSTFMVLVLLVCVCGIGGWIYLDRWLKTPQPLADAVVVDVPHGLGTMDIGQSLVSAGVLDRPWLFLAGVKLAARGPALKAGEYKIQPGETPAQIIEAMQTGAVLLHPVTLPEGRTVKEAFAILSGYDFLTGDLPDLPAEGSLLPETYLVAKGTTRRQIVARMSGDMAKVLAAGWASRAVNYPLSSPAQLLVLASIIERETAKSEEYPLVAAVFINRLRRGMRLQTDPTVIYGLSDGMGAIGRPLTRTDLASDTPYNTYRIAGLPPGPIANPGRRAIMAAARPALVDYLYFVADGTGGHVFASTLAEHNRNVAAWRKLQADKTAGSTGSGAATPEATLPPAPAGDPVAPSAPAEPVLPAPAESAAPPE